MTNHLHIGRIAERNAISVLAARERELLNQNREGATGPGWAAELVSVRRELRRLRKAARAAGASIPEAWKRAANDRIADELAGTEPTLEMLRRLPTTAAFDRPCLSCGVQVDEPGRLLCPGCRGRA